MQASLPPLPAGHTGLPAKSSPESLKEKTHILSSTQHSLIECIEILQSASSLWFPTFPRMPWQRTEKDFEPVALDMCRWSEWKHSKSKKVGVFSVEKKQHLWLQSIAAVMHSGLFPDTVGVEIGHSACSVINSSLYNYWMSVLNSGCRKTPLIFDSEELTQNLRCLQLNLSILWIISWD